MAYMTNAQFKVLGRVWTELMDNNGRLTFEAFCEFSQVMREIQTDKNRAKEKAWERIKEKRKVNKNYAR